MATMSRGWWWRPPLNEACAVWSPRFSPRPVDGALSLSLIHATYLKKALQACEFAPSLKEFSFLWPAVTTHLLYSFYSYFSPGNCSRCHHSIFLCWSLLDFTHGFYTSLQLSSNNPIDIISISLSRMTKLQHKEAGYFS